jgi:hypothetical protein
MLTQKVTQTHVKKHAFTHKIVFFKIGNSIHHIFYHYSISNYVTQTNIMYNNSLGLQPVLKVSFSTMKTLC